MGCILPTMHCRSQHCWELLHPFAYHCQPARNNFQHCWRNNVGSCCFRLHAALILAASLTLRGHIFKADLCHAYWLIISCSILSVVLRGLDFNSGFLWPIFSSVKVFISARRPSILIKVLFLKFSFPKCVELNKELLHVVFVLFCFVLFLFRQRDEFLLCCVTPGPALLKILLRSTDANLKKEL